jgi:hypothetical protein
MIDLSTATFIGPELTDTEVLETVPKDYREFLMDVNGCVLFGGGLHLRGACNFPEWHSLRQVWIGPDALSSRYGQVEKDDFPFAQDVFGDQFFLREGFAIRLEAETGDITALGMTWQEFLNAATCRPVEFLPLQPLTRYLSDGGTIQPGQLLSVYPPFCTSESANGVSLKAIPAMERIRFLADFAAQLASVADATKVRMRVEGPTEGTRPVDVRANLRSN